VDKHIVSLRQKLEDNPSEPRWIHTVHGTGYRFDF
jgi:DNA-binding response OmpR family regulator